MLKVIGAGFGRTGTLSLKGALEMLGFGPCYHMLEVLKRPHHDRLWHAAATGSSPVWDTLFDSFQAAIDWPAVHFWQALSIAYPDAKIILTVRDEHAWYESIRQTIFAAINHPDGEHGIGYSKYRLMTRELIFKQVFDERTDDEQYVCAVYRAHNNNVIETVPTDRLLVYRPGEGWERLCAFLNVDVPDTPYPHVNSSRDYRAKFVSPD